MEAGLYFLRLSEIDHEIKLENEINNEADDKVKDFNEKLPQLISKLEKNNLSSEVIDLSKSGTKSPSSVLPSIYAQKNNKTFCCILDRLFSDYSDYCACA